MRLVAGGSSVRRRRRRSAVIDEDPGFVLSLQEFDDLLGKRVVNASRISVGKFVAFLHDVRKESAEIRIAQFIEIGVVGRIESKLLEPAESGFDGGMTFEHVVKEARW